MKRKQTKKQVYVRPTIKVIHIPYDRQLMQASNSGGHNKVGNDSPLNAKQGNFEEEEEEEYLSRRWDF